jgi:hypothetical protein
MAVEHTIITKTGHKVVKLTRRNAIRQKCMECSGWFAPEVRKCVCQDCALWPFRMGTEIKSETRIYAKSEVLQHESRPEDQNTTFSKVS